MTVQCECGGDHEPWQHQDSTIEQDFETVRLMLEGSSLAKDALSRIEAHFDGNAGGTMMFALEQFRYGEQKALAERDALKAALDNIRKHHPIDDYVQQTADQALDQLEGK